MEPIIRTEKLSKTYGLDGLGGSAPLSGAIGTLSVPALDDVNVEISSGEMVAIMGPSGCGKSTLMHLLGLLDTPSLGRILFKDQDISKYSEDERALFRSKEVGFIFQQFNLLPRLTTLENVLLPTLYYHSNSNNTPVVILGIRQLAETPESTINKATVGRSEDAGQARLAEAPAKRASMTSALSRAKHLLTEVGLENRYNHKPNQLSGGEQQRVAIARALINEPSLILADEPTGNLDSHSGTEIMSLLKELNGKGKTLVIVTHDSSIAGQCQRTIRMKDGRVLGS